MTLIPQTLLNKAEKMLFIAHLAIGDFTYLQNFFQAFGRANPQIKIDLWIDEVRCTADPEKWEFLKKYALYDWTENCACLRKIYRQTYSPALREESIRQAQQENYPLVVSIATLRPNQYASLAREIAPNGLVIGIKKKTPWYAPWQRADYRKLDASFAPFTPGPAGYHITEVYADWFRQLAALELDSAARFPFVEIPQQWSDWADQQLSQWQHGSTGKAVFINTFAKTHKRCWGLDSAAELIIAMRKQPQWQHTRFIINAVPQEMAATKKILDAYHLEDTHLFSADQNFFQLPAILKRCDLIISVETAVMHLANAVHVPVIALMRQKNPEWVPIDSANSKVITTAHRSQWVKAITVAQVIDALPPSQECQ